MRGELAFVYQRALRGVDSRYGEVIWPLDLLHLLAIRLIVVGLESIKAELRHQELQLLKCSLYYPAEPLVCMPKMFCMPTSVTRGHIIG